MVLEKVKKILSDQFDVEEDSITPDTLIADDLGADSLDVVDLLMSIEDELSLIHICSAFSGERAAMHREGAPACTSS